MRPLPWSAPQESELPFYQRTPGTVGLPVGDRRCVTCLHPLREVIEEHLDGGTSAATIKLILEDRGIPGPSAESIRNHHRRHRVAPAAARRVQEATEQLDEYAAALAENRELRRRCTPDAPLTPAGSTADAPALPA